MRWPLLQPIFTTLPPYHEDAASKGKLQALSQKPLGLRQRGTRQSIRYAYLLQVWSRSSTCLQGLPQDRPHLAKRIRHSCIGVQPKRIQIIQVIHIYFLEWSARLRIEAQPSWNLHLTWTQAIKLRQTVLRADLYWGLHKEGLQDHQPL